MFIPLGSPLWRQLDQIELKLEEVDEAQGAIMVVWREGKLSWHKTNSRYGKIFSSKHADTIVGYFDRRVPFSVLRDAVIEHISQVGEVDFLRR